MSSQYTKYPLSGGSQGATGLRGPTGPADGDQGVTGLRGTTGLIGATGVRGLTGLQGITGIQGATGAQGATGTDGVQGGPGQTGVQGATGVQGIDGATGIRGLTGAGIQGSTGLQGSQGSTGVGIQGATGTQGIQGVTGIRGFTGAGIQGATGTFAPVGFAVSDSSGVFTTTSATLVPVTNLAVSFSSNGAPVQLLLQSDGSGNAAYIDPQASVTMNYAFYRDATQISLIQIGGPGILTPALAPSIISFIDSPPAGAYVYTLWASISDGETLTVNHCVLAAMGRF